LTENDKAQENVRKLKGMVPDSIMKSTARMESTRIDDTIRDKFGITFDNLMYNCHE